MRNYTAPSLARELMRGICEAEQEARQRRAAVIASVQREAGFA